MAPRLTCRDWGWGNEALKVTGLGDGQRQENGGINLREVTAQIQGGHQLLECSIWEF